MKHKTEVTGMHCSEPCLRISEGSRGCSGVFRDIMPAYRENKPHPGHIC